MNSKFNELSLKLDKSSHDIRFNIQYLESLVDEYSKYNKKYSKSNEITGVQGLISNMFFKSIGITGVKKINQ